MCSRQKFNITNFHLHLPSLPYTTLHRQPLYHHHLHLPPFTQLSQKHIAPIIIFTFIYTLHAYSENISNVPNTSIHPPSHSTFTLQILKTPQLFLFNLSINPFSSSNFFITITINTPNTHSIFPNSYAKRHTHKLTHHTYETHILHASYSSLPISIENIVNANIEALNC